MTTPSVPLTAGTWTRAERARLSGILGIIALLHITRWSLHFSYSRNLAAAGSFTAAAVTAYVLGVRHAFDAALADRFEQRYGSGE